MLDKKGRLWAAVVAVVVVIILFLCMIVLDFEGIKRRCDSNLSDFGGVPEVAGLGLLEEITDCEGDIDLITLDEIDWSRSTDGSIVIRLSPSQCIYMTSKIVWMGGETYGTPEKRGVMGFAEKKVGCSWRRVGEIYVYLANNAGPMLLNNGAVGEVDPRAQRWCSVSPEDARDFKDIRVELPEYNYGATYRVTYFFITGDEDGNPYGGVHSVRHTVTLPKKTNKRLDFVCAGWEDAGWFNVYPEIRVNYGETPYLALDACYVEHEQDGQWVKSTHDGESAFSYWWHIGSGSPIIELKQCETLANHYRVPEKYELYLSLLDGTDPDNQPADFRLTLVFCDNADGSGERYTLTLYLNTEILKEYEFKPTYY